jgi:hypothetical protein
MAEQIYGLSEDDLLLLREVISYWKNLPRNARNRPAPDPSDQTTTDIYVAETPSGGIPARVGTTVGIATCNIYRIDAATQKLTKVGTTSKRVCNLSTSEIMGNIYIPVAKEKYNQYVVTGTTDTTAGTGTGTGATVHTVLSDFNAGTCVFTKQTWVFHNGKLFSVT